MRVKSTALVKASRWKRRSKARRHGKFRSWWYDEEDIERLYRFALGRGFVIGFLVTTAWWMLVILRWYT